MTNSELILAARLIAPHGLEGAMSAESFSDFPERFRAGAVLLDEEGRRHIIRGCAPHKGRLLLTLEGIEDRAAADKLRGQRLYIRPEDSPALPEGSYYHYQLLGLTVYQQGEVLGRVTDVLSYTANDIYVLERTGGGQTLIPALKSVVLSIDLNAGRMEVDLPEGL